jgi:hypothetical protein
VAGSGAGSAVLNESITVKIADLENGGFFLSVWIFGSCFEFSHVCVRVFRVFLPFFFFFIFSYPHKIGTHADLLFYSHMD